MKNKKKLNDKERKALKDKYKHIGKMILDILMYGFAIIMSIALAVGGACAPKKASAVYYGERYTSYEQVNIDRDIFTYPLYAPINNNGRYILPDFFAILEYRSKYNDFPSTFNFNNVIKIGDSPTNANGVIYNDITYLGIDCVYQNSTFNFIVWDSNYNYHIVFYTNVNGFTFDYSYVPVWNAIFNGKHYIYDNSIPLQRFFLFYYSTNAYRYIQSEFYYNNMKEIYSYMIDNSNNLGDNFAFNGWAFYSDYLYSQLIENQDRPQIEFVPILSGSFSVRGEYFSSISFVIAPIYNRLNADFILNGESTGINGYFEEYERYFYIEAIRFNRFGGNGSIEVCSIKKSSNGSVWLDTFEWLGGDNSLNQNSPYRIINIFYVIPYSSDMDIFPLLNGVNSIQFLNNITITTDLPLSQNQSIDTVGDYPILSVFEWLRRALTGIIPLFSLVLIPGITIGTVLLLPFAVMVLLFVIKLFKR